MSVDDRITAVCVADKSGRLHRELLRMGGKLTDLPLEPEEERAFIQWAEEFIDESAKALYVFKMARNDNRPSFGPIRRQIQAAWELQGIISRAAEGSPI